MRFLKQAIQMHIQKAWRRIVFPCGKTKAEVEQMMKDYQPGRVQKHVDKES